MASRHVSNSDLHGYRRYDAKKSSGGFDWLVLYRLAINSYANRTEYQHDRTTDSIGMLLLI